MRTELNKSMPFAGLTVGQVTEMLEDLLAREVKPMSTMPEIIGIEEVAQITGYTPATIYSLTHKRIIPFHKPPGGRKLFFLTAEIYDWLKTNRVETNDNFVRNHRQGKHRRPNNGVKKIQKCLRNLKVLQPLLLLIKEMLDYQEVEIKILQNQIAQYEIQIECLTKNK